MGLKLSWVILALLPAIVALFLAHLTRWREAPKFARVPSEQFKVNGTAVNAFEGCKWRDPEKVLFIRVPKTGTTALSNAMSSAAYGRYRMVPLPEFPLGIGAVMGLDRSRSPKKFLNLVTKALTRKSPPGLRVVSDIAAFLGIRDFTYLQKDVLEGHVFIHTGADKPRYSFKKWELQTPKFVANIALARDPVQRLMSGYEYTRNRPMQEKERIEFAERYGNKTIGECVLDPRCAQVNELGRLCSLHALYYCGHHRNCTMQSPRDIGETEVPVATDEAVERAVKAIRLNGRDTLLLVVPLEDLLDSSVSDPSESSEVVDGYEMLEMLLPTFFLGLREEGMRIDSAEQSAYDLSKARKSGKGVRPLPEDPEQRSALLHLCRQDIKVYQVVKEQYKEKVAQCTNQKELLKQATAAHTE